MTFSFRRSAGVLVLGAMLWAGQPAHAGLFDFKVSPDKERKLGDEAAREIDGGAKLVTGPVADWVERVGSRLASVSNPEFKYSFRVIDSPEINAFALPGGYVYVFTGLRKVVKTDDELAAVLAHEITHAEEHHYAKQYAKASKRGLLLGVLSIAVGLPGVAQQGLSLVDAYSTQRYSRVSESEADLRGLERMTRAGFNPQGMVSLLSNMGREERGGDQLNEWFASHPDANKRISDVRRAMTNLRPTPLRSVAPASPPPAVAPVTPVAVTPVAIAP